MVHSVLLHTLVFSDLARKIKKNQATNTHDSHLFNVSCIDNRTVSERF